MSNEADALYDNLRGFLKLRAYRVSPPSNEDINVREKFTLRFALTNKAYPLTWVSKPNIIFLNPFIHVTGTDYASTTQEGWHSFPDKILKPGERTYLDIEFTAIKNIGGLFDIWWVEHVANVRLWARLDQDQFFTLEKSANVYEEIEPT